MDALESYLVELSASRLAGAVPETSGYGALQTLLNEVGQKLKPRVRCVVNPANAGAGIPDGGFFVASQFEKGVTEPLLGQLPARGALEVKSVEANVCAVAAGQQVRRYLEKYRQVLVTTYREFVLVGYDADGEPKALETYSLADTETGFQNLLWAPRAAARQQGGRLSEFLKRCLLRQAPIATSQDLAWFLASYAREARARAEEHDLPALATTRAALGEALGMSFSGEKGDHFFRSTLVQTLFYGLFAAWVFWAEHHQPTDAVARFRWREAAGYLHIPILQKLFYDFANPAQLGALKLDEVLDWAAEALNRVDRASFFDTFEQSHAVQYFYEPFLEAFDPQLRKGLGVWYTPPEIVQYMVARVDQVLRSELDIPDGLADPRVVVLDPCCGTGAYLVEVLGVIASTLREKGDDALLAHDLKQAALSRIYGFEILPAPFVISHLQIGMLLHRLGAPLADESDERAGVYLTNALTGWEPPTEPKQHLLFPEMEEERDKAQAVKQHAPILVIVGNPPYNIFAGVAIDEERELSTAYLETKQVAAPQGRGLNDLYVRFFRMAERRVTEGAQGEGIVCFISNYSWLDGLSHTGMRERYLDVFDGIGIDCLNGDKYKSGKLTPEGEPDPSVFSTEKNREGIQVGTAIAVLVRKQQHQPAGEIEFRHFWGREKRSDLLESVASRAGYETIKPSLSVGLPFAPSVFQAGYLGWPVLTDLLATSSPGVTTARDSFVVDIDRSRLDARMRLYFDARVTDEQIREVAPAALADASRFDGEGIRRRLVARGYREDCVVPYAYRPFDIRWLYWEPDEKLLHEKREDLFAMTQSGSRLLVTRQKGERQLEGPLLYTTRRLCDLHLTRPNTTCFPLERQERDQGSLLAARNTACNVSDKAKDYLAGLEVEAYDDRASALWYHCVAIGYAPVYLRENAGALRQDWPRIPLPASRDALLASAAWGGHVAALVDAEEPVSEVTTGTIRHELRALGILASASGCQLNPATGDLAMRVGWGNPGRDGVTMPGKGRLVERPYTDLELAAFREGLTDLGMTIEDLLASLGESCYDVSLNDVAYWRCVPQRVWTYTIGGYQVIKKWLSYRERSLLGRDLTVEEARYVTEMVRRLAAICLLEPALDANYEAVKADTYEWRQAGAVEEVVDELAAPAPSAGPTST